MFAEHSPKSVESDLPRSVASAGYRLGFVARSVLALLAVAGIMAMAAVKTTPASATAAVSGLRGSESAVALPARAGDTSDGAGLGVVDAIVLGVVEGVTEYLPVSSTGHLWVTERLLGIGDTPSELDAADSFAIVIQFGAILAVLVLYWNRVKSVVLGLFGRDDEGRHLLICIALAFIPAVVIALLAEDVIKEHLFGGWPIVIAWAVGAVAILALRHRLDESADRAMAPVGMEGAVDGGRPTGRALLDMDYRTALIIGGAQAVAMWPGTSRSLITILAAVLMGMSLASAVEFSFLLGLLTLGAATGFEALKSGDQIVSNFGLGTPILGIVVAAVTAAASVKWMVGYLQRHSFAVFGYYRLAAAAVTAVLLGLGTI